MPKPYSQACENNKGPILPIIAKVFREGGTVLEIGSGTGQHAVFFAAELPQLTWQPSDTPDSLSTLQAGLAGEKLPNLLPPLSLDVRQPHWPLDQADGIFSANCLHIMPEEAMADFFAGAGPLLPPGGHLCVYGPFRYRGAYTSPSNASFDDWLKARDPRGGIRDVETADGLAREAGLQLVADHAMPANNQLIIWEKLK